MRILGIETSCDETATAVVENGDNLLSNVVASSMDLHVKYGGVVPEVAARSHIEAINPVIEQALTEAKCTWDQIDGIAVTYGAGLGGSLLIGVLAARTLAILHDKPLYACNHVEGHIYANFLTCTGTPLPASRQSPAQVQQWSLNGQTYTLPSLQPEFPMLALIVSGGHTQLALFRNHFDYQILGRTHDDAIGEAFDKVAKILGLPYPGGPSIAETAAKGDPNKYALPKAKLADMYGFSFSGLKTAVLRLAQKETGHGHDYPSYKLADSLSEAQKANIAASFQRIAVETVVDKAMLAFEAYQPKSVVVAGGVAANQELRHQLEVRLSEVITLQDSHSSAVQGDNENRTNRTNGTESKTRRQTTQHSAENIGRVDGSADKQTDVARILQYTDIKLCTDNGAMIATLGCFKVKLGQKPTDPYSLDIAPNLTM